MTTPTTKEIWKAIHRSQHCQRNWDLTKSIPDEHVQLFLDAATQCPSKQNKTFYKTHVLQSREVIEKFHKLTKGFGLYPDPDNPGEMTSQTNPQVLANLVVVFEEYTPEQDDHNFKWAQGARPDHVEEALIARDQNQAVGVAAGYLNVIASMLGYETGCCGCFDFEAVKELLGFEGHPLLAMGIGFKDENRNRRMHHIDDVKFPTIRKGEMPIIRH